jgi:hypothetical protein
MDLLQLARSGAQTHTPLYGINRILLDQPGRKKESKRRIQRYNRRQRKQLIPVTSRKTSQFTDHRIAVYLEIRD